MGNRSLGTLTLDLVARIGGFEQGMDKAARASKKRTDAIRGQLKVAGTAMVAFAATSTAALVAMTRATLDNSREVIRLSQISGAGAKEFQRYAAGARYLGVEQEKLSDIFKDTGDKVGDFLETGGGPLADFFDNIAPKVGVTAAQFRDLSGPKALQLYVDSLEKANLSQSQMTFYMEAIASDATMLLPLLKNGGEGFKLLGDEAERAGVILSDKTLSSAQELNTVLFLMEQSSVGFKNQLVEGMLPTLRDLGLAFSDVSVDTAIASEVGSTLTNVMKGLAAAGVGAWAAVQLVGKSIAGLVAVDAAATEGGSWYERLIPGASAVRLIKNWDGVKNQLGVVGDDLDETAMRYGGLIDKIWSAGDDSNTKGKSQIKLLADLLSQRDSLLAGGGTQSSSADADAEAARKAAAAKLQSVVDSLQTEEESILASYRNRREIILANTEETSLARQSLLYRLEQQTNEKLGELNQGFWANYLDAASDALTSLDDIASTTIGNFSSGMGAALESMVFDATSTSDAFKQLGEGMARSVINALGQMAAQWLAYKAVQLLVGKATAASAATSMIAQAETASTMAALHSFSSTAAIPIVGPAAAPGAAAAAKSATLPLVASVAASSFAGLFDQGGSIGSGKWGIVGERGPEIVQGPAHVTGRNDTARMMGGGNVTVNLVEDASKAGQVDKAPSADGMTITAFVSSIRGDGPAARVLEQTYGLRRVGS